MFWTTPAKVLRRSGLVTVAAITETETFDTAAGAGPGGLGYDLTWTETIGGLTALNENKTGASCLSSECLEVAYPTGFAAIGHTFHEMSSALTTVYFRFYLYVSTDGLTDQYNLVFTAQRSGGAVGGEADIAMRLTDVGGTLSLSLLVGGDTDSRVISTATSYRIEIAMNTATGAWDWRVDGGASEGSGTEIIGASIRDVRFGSMIVSNGASTFSIDSFKFSDQTWVGP